MNKMIDIALLFWLALVLTMIIGWVMNIVTIFSIDELVINGELILRVAGIIIVPIGAIMGIFV